jgi:hypothetical protein
MYFTFYVTVDISLAFVGGNVEQSSSEVAAIIIIIIIIIIS